MSAPRPGIEYFARIAACAALLTTSFLGQWLHHLQHNVCGHECSQSAHSCYPQHTHRHSCEHSHSCSHSIDHEKTTPDHNSPAVPHDHNSCNICYVIGQAIANPVLTTAPIVTEPLFEQLRTESEFSAPASRCIPIARGPPAFDGRC